MSERHPNLVVSDHGAVRVIRIDREDKLGALSRGLVEALGTETARLANDDSVRSVVLTGTGRGFIAGADIGEYAHADEQQFENYQRESRGVFESVAQLPQVTIAAVNGYAFGGGLELALCCDLIIAADTAAFGLPEVALGLIPGGGGLRRLAQSGGTRWAKDMILSGRTARAPEMLERGVVSALAPRDELFDRALAWAQSFAANAPLAVRAANALLSDPDHDPDDEVVELVRLFLSRDGQEGIRAFQEKREAVFSGE